MSEPIDPTNVIGRTAHLMGVPAENVARMLAGEKRPAPDAEGEARHTTASVASKTTDGSERESAGEIPEYDSRSGGVAPASLASPPDAEGVREYWCSSCGDFQPCVVDVDCAGHTEAVCPAKHIVASWRLTPKGGTDA